MLFSLCFFASPINATPTTDPVVQLSPTPSEAQAQGIAQVNELLADARKLKRIGDVRGALDQLNELRKLDDANPEAEAIRQEIAKQLVFVRNEAERQRQADSFLQRGWEFERAENFSAALGSYNVALVMYSSREEMKMCADRVAHALKIQTALDTARQDELADKLQDAVTALDELHRFDPEIATAGQMTSRLLERIRVEKQLAALMAIATTLESQGNFRGALEACDEALKLDPGFAAAKLRRAVEADKISQITTAALADASRAYAASNYASALKALDSLSQYGSNADATALRIKILADVKTVSDRRETSLLSLMSEAKSLTEAGDPQKALGLLDTQADSRALNLKNELKRQMADAESERKAGDSALAQAQVRQAFDAYRHAVSGGSVRAMVSLSNMYRQGQGVAADPAAGETWLKRAADRGDGEAMETFAAVLRVRDPASAVSWYERAVAARRPTAARPLAEMYERGQGVTKDPAKALDYYLIAASNNDPVAIYRVAQMYEKGIGTAKDLSRATDWYQKAAKRGDADAVAWIKRNERHGPALIKNAQ